MSITFILHFFPPESTHINGKSPKDSQCPEPIIFMILGFSDLAWKLTLIDMSLIVF